MRVLVSRPDKIGDLILALHGVKQLKKMLPDCEVYLHVSKYGLPFARLIGFVDGCIVHGEDLRPYRFDAVVDLIAKIWTAREYRAAGIPVRIGNAARWFRFLYNRTLWVRRSQARLNEAEYNWQFLSLLDPSLHRTSLSEKLCLSDFRDFAEFDELHDYTVLMYSITASAVRWETEHWKALLRLLAEKEPGETLLLIGPYEREHQAEFAKSCTDLPRARVCCIEDFRQLIGILKNARAYVGTSTGSTHLASALGVPGVALYPETLSMHPRRWCPFESTLEIVSLDRKPTPEQVYETLRKKISAPELNPLHREAVSAFVVCCNEEANIRRCLESLKWCDEIVVVDSGSRDRTVEICREYTDKVFHRPWRGHREQKQFALEQCSCKWVVNIDSDEEVSAPLRGEILRVLSRAARGENVAHGYRICRLVYFLNRWWDRGGWYPEYRMRFFQRSATHWGGVNPHEKAIVEGRVERLSGDIHHYTYSGLADQIESLNKHSSYAALHLFREGRRCNLVRLALNPMMRFFKFYVTKRGFREGRAGLVVACIEASYTFFKYAKLWELQRRQTAGQLAQQIEAKVEAYHGHGPFDSAESGGGEERRAAARAG